MRKIFCSQIQMLCQNDLLCCVWKSIACFNCWLSKDRHISSVCVFVSFFKPVCLQYAKQISVNYNMSFMLCHYVHPQDSTIMSVTSVLTILC